MRGIKLSMLLSLLAVTGCGVLPAPHTNSTADQVAELKQRVLELQRQAAKDNVEIARLRDRLAEARSTPGSDHGGKAESPGAQKSPTSVEPPVAAAEESSTPPASSTAAKAITSEDLPAKSSDVAASAGSAATSKSTVGGETEKPAGTAATGQERPLEPIGASEAITPEVQALYDRGYTAFHQRHYVEAESTFGTFLERYPRSELADNASYWIGEARLQRQDVRGAMKAFQETVEKYPQGNKVPDALLKVGECLESLGDSDSARLSYEEVIKRFPNSAASEVAKERQAKLE